MEIEKKEKDAKRWRRETFVIFRSRNTHTHTPPHAVQSGGEVLLTECVSLPQ